MASKRQPYRCCGKGGILFQTVSIIVFQNLLSAATLAKDLEKMKWLIDHGANPNVTDKEGDVPLHLASSIPCAKLLVNSGADINALDKVTFVLKIIDTCSMEMYSTV